ncbi:hypothetical protein MCOR25_007966 [Pyricularia grisea]|uniref:Uncharacterized protein n=1 Tax=Pyricularia grisea TaxID=148305 RepID=A0A6P8BEH3_PYRGI|nr:uncharacterized protein PgNI_04157 [Pyricularia grisea]KAI6356090.1 hypothetical protein MCOR25_007966 [Pyricularia grisea]TLD14154.1 hypothetical protein PgNI_04157 [Pyricularia grisea]
MDVTNISGRGSYEVRVAQAVPRLDVPKQEKGDHTRIDPDRADGDPVELHATVTLHLQQESNQLSHPWLSRSSQVHWFRERIWKEHELVNVMNLTIKKQRSKVSGFTSIVYNPIPVRKFACGRAKFHH